MVPEITLQPSSEEWININPGTGGLSKKQSTSITDYHILRTSAIPPRTLAPTLQARETRSLPPERMIILDSHGLIQKLNPQGIYMTANQPNQVYID